MNRRKFSILTAVTVVTFGLGSRLVSRTAATGHATKLERATGTLQRNDAAVVAFASIIPVLRHPRCMNCHSSGDFPREGDDGHPHAMNVRRGPIGLGVTSQKCGACHQGVNVAGLNMPPGAPNWRLPPPRMPMIWQGLTDHQLCEHLKDPKQNGNRTVDQIVEHMAEDKLVGWGWQPGEGRTPIPMGRAEFAAKAKDWAAKGAACPAN